MKALRTICFLLTTIILSGCGLTKMSTKYNTVNFSVTPSILETHAGKVNVKLDAKFPPKYFAKKSLVEFTPVLIHEGGETSFKTIKVQGEEATGGEATVFYITGGGFSYEDEINYTPSMINSKLEIRALAKIQNKKGTTAAIASSIAKLDNEQILGPTTLADGVIATATRTTNSEEPAIAHHGYEKETILSENATVYFLVNQSNIRTTEKSKDAVKKLKEFASQGNKTSSVEIKSYASPEGTIGFNDKVSEKRMKSTLKYVKWLMKRVGLDGANNTALYTENSVGEDWDGFNKLMRSSKIKDKTKINRIVNSVEDLEKREQAIRDMTELYDAIKEDILPQLRKAEITVQSYAPKKTDEEIISFLMNQEWEKIDVNEALYGVSLDIKQDPITMYEQIAETYNDWRGYNNIACWYLNQNLIDQAVSYLKKAEDIGGSQNEITINKGIVASWNGELNNAQKLFNSGSASENNQAILNIRRGDYEKAARFFKNNNSYNATLAKVLNGNNNVSCNESNAECYYLNAIIGARTNNENMILTNLKKAITTNVTYKDEAKKDLEFRNYFSNTAFQELVN